MLVGIVVQANSGSTLQPAIPVIPGLTPLTTTQQADRSFALYELDRFGLQLLELAGVNPSTTGDYTIELFIAGDVNVDGLIDGLDQQLFKAALGSSTRRSTIRDHRRHQPPTESSTKPTAA